MTKIVKFNLFLLVFLFALRSPAMAGFGASPATLFKDNIFPGTTFTQDIVVSRSDPDEDMNVIIEPDLKEMTGWITYPNSQKIIFPKGQNRLSIPITVTVPETAALKSYNGSIRLKAVSLTSQEGIAVAKGARVDVNYLVSNTAVKDIEVKSINVENTKTNQPIYATLVVENKGNTQTWPSKVTMDVYDLKEKLLESLETTDLSVNTGNSQFNIVAKFNPKVDLNSGDYIAQTKVFMGTKVLRNEKLLFRVLGASTVNAQEPDTPVQVYENATSNHKIAWWMIVLFFVFLIIINAVAAYLIYRLAKPPKFAVILFVQLIEMLLLSLLFIQYVAKMNYAPYSHPEVKSSTISLIPTGAPSVNHTLSVVSPDSIPLKNEYLVHESPDTSSKVLYHAKDGEKFEVLEEQSSWYRVTVSTGQSGWLQKSSIASQN